MDGRIFELLKQAYQIANEICDDELAKGIYQLVYAHSDFWDSDEDEYERIMNF